MPELILCPKCQHPLRVPAERLGRPVKCLNCGQAFIAGVNPHLPDPPPETPAVGVSSTPLPVPGPPRAPDSSVPTVFESDSDLEYSPQLLAGWQKVKTGLTLILLAIGFWAASAIVFSVGNVVLEFRKPEKGSTTALAILVAMPLAGVGFMSCFLLSVVGHGFCAFIPGRLGARLAAWFCLVTQVVSAGLFLFGLAVLSSPESAGGPRYEPDSPKEMLGVLLAIFGGYLLSLLQWIVLVFFLKAVCRGTDNDGLAKSVGSLLWLGGSIVASFVMQIVVGLLAIPSSSSKARAGMEGALWLGIGFGCLTIMLILVFAFWYVACLRQVRDAVAHFLQRNQ